MAVLSNTGIRAGAVAHAAAAGGGGGDSGFQIERSLRFNSGDSAHLQRTFSAGNQKKFTWSGWIKRGKTGTGGAIFSSASSNDSNPRTDWAIFNDTLNIGFNPSGSTWLEVNTTKVFRDHSAWYHIVVAVDTTQGTNTDRVKVFVNGKRETSFSTYSTISQNLDMHINSAVTHTIGRYEAGDIKYWDGLMADVHFIDGLALYPLAFAEWDASGAWVPRAFRKWSPNDGTDFSGDGTATGTWSNASGSGGHAQMFDGNTSNLAYNSGGANTYATFTFDTPIPFSTIRLHAGEHGTADTQILINDKDLKYHFTWSVSGSWVDITSQVPGNKLEKISLKDKGSASSNIRAIEIDGEILEDSATYQNYTQWAAATSDNTNSFHLKFDDTSAIGEDSLKSNDFTVTNINTTNNLPNDGRTWSSTVTLSSGGWNGSYPVTKGFNAELGASDRAESADTGAVATIPYTGTINANGIEVNAAVTSSQPVVVKLYNSSTLLHTLSSGSSGQQWHTFTFSACSITSFTVERTDRAVEFNGIKINGHILQDDLNSSYETDSLTDTPTNYAGTGSDGAGGVTRGNYATLNPLSSPSNSTITNGNLQSALGGTEPDIATMGMKSGKWYWEVYIAASNYPRIGVFNIGDALPANLGGTAQGWCFLNSPSRTYNGASATNYGSLTFAAGTTIGLAYDADTGKLWVSENGTWQASGNPATGANPGMTVTGSPSKLIAPAVATGSGGTTVHMNFGQRPFKTAAPSGFKCLCTNNLGDTFSGEASGTVNNPSKFFDITTWIGNGEVRDHHGLGFSPDLIWIKSTDQSQGHTLYDTARGVQKKLHSHLPAANSANDGDTLTAFLSDGFTQGEDPWGNDNGDDYVGWFWDANDGTGVSNSEGDITSTVRANTASGFSIVTFTSNDTDNQKVGHGLNNGPELIILKNLDSSEDWWVFHVGGHASGPWNDHTLYLNANNATTGSWGTVNNVAPDEDVVNLSNSTNTAPNDDTDDKIMYCFAPIAGFSAFGNWVGNNSTNGPFIYTGFRPRFILIKRVDDSANWRMLDSKRGYNGSNEELYPNLTNAQGAAQYVDFVSNGFKIRTTDGNYNASSGLYIYSAFAERPFKTARGAI